MGGESWVEVRNGYCQFTPCRGGYFQFHNINFTIRYIERIFCIWRHGLAPVLRHLLHPLICIPTIIHSSTRPLIAAHRNLIPKTPSIIPLARCDKD